MKTKKATIEAVTNKQQGLLNKRAKDFQQAKDNDASRVEEILEKEWLEFMLTSKRGERF